MNGTKFSLTKVLVCALVCGVAASLSAADGTTPPPGGGGGGQRNFDPAAMRARYQERLKTEMGSTDDEWKALQPKLDDLMKASFATRTGGGFGRRGGGQGGGGTPPADNPDRTDLQKKGDALRTLLENKDADPKAIAAALKDLRDAKAAAKEALKKQQDGIKELLTARQEAVLVQNGLLD
jgi:Spy/CpxP family protein refolding chaperone